jgi:hypothetical protein
LPTIYRFNPPSLNERNNICSTWDLICGC